MSSTGIFSVLICKADRIPDNCAVLYSWWWCMSVVIVKRGLVLFIFPVIFFPWHSCVGDTIWFLSNLTGVQILWLRKRFSTNARIYPGSCTPTSATKKYSPRCSSFIIILDFPYKKRRNIHCQRGSLRHYHLFCFVFFGTTVSVFSGMSCQIRDVWSDNINIVGDRAEYISND